MVEGPCSGAACIQATAAAEDESKAIPASIPQPGQNLSLSSPPHNIKDCYHFKQEHTRNAADIRRLSVREDTPQAACHKNAARMDTHDSAAQPVSCTRGTRCCSALLGAACPSWAAVPTICNHHPTHINAAAAAAAAVLQVQLLEHSQLAHAWHLSNVVQSLHSNTTQYSRTGKSGTGSQLGTAKRQAGLHMRRALASLPGRPPLQWGNTNPCWRAPPTAVRLPAHAA